MHKSHSVVSFWYVLAYQGICKQGHPSCPCIEWEAWGNHSRTADQSCTTSLQHKEDFHHWKPKYKARHLALLSANVYAHRGTQRLPVSARSACWQCLLDLCSSTVTRAMCYPAFYYQVSRARCTSAREGKNSILLCCLPVEIMKVYPWTLSIQTLLK